MTEQNRPVPPIAGHLYQEFWPHVETALRGGLSYRQIEARVGVSRETARRWAAANGLVRRSGARAARARQLSAEHRSVASIARELGACRASIYRWLANAEPADATAA